ncbi:HlyD family secretion protein [Rhizobium sp. P28RR-XV]|uniref:HlyD family secretion protein n=1 Tax=Rhizobium sp. P28RR-XV TaxID=2726737 RepID=UPI0014565C61|nr:HlyD family secretion protein [Rhizobium sp. P28RR-XV]NLR88434.1 HlyD family secretion protein [Rhizobium sp. P28RR-XV]
MAELLRRHAVKTPETAEISQAPSGPAADAATPPDGARQNKADRKIIKRGALAVVLLGVVMIGAKFGYQYWTVGRFIESTDDAYVKADYTTIAPKVSGYIAAVMVSDNEQVKAGQILAQIDDRDYKTALDQAKAGLKSSEASITNIDAQLVEQQSAIEQAKATIVSAQASLKFAEADNERYQNLIQSGAGNLQHAQQSAATRDEATAEVQRDQAALVAEEKKIGVLQTQRNEALAQRDNSAAATQQAELNLSYTQIIAPVDGTIGARTLRVGQYVASGTQLMAVVPLNTVYVVANFKETQLTYVRPHQSVDIKVDSFPDISMKGHVDSISPASGLEFSLLPPDNATGNFTKIVQRIPVKITIDDASLAGLLRSGMSVEPDIDTRASAQAKAD